MGRREGAGGCRMGVCTELYITRGLDHMYRETGD